MRFLVSLISIISIAGAHSCNTNSSYHQTTTDSIPIISVKDPDFDLSIESIVDSIQIIQLETVPEALIGDIRSLQVLQHKFYVLDPKGTTILSFDKTGKFLNKMQMQGRGPNEYIMLQWIYADPVSRKILAADGVVNKIFIYDENLNLEQVVKTDFIPWFVTALRDNLILQYQSENKERVTDELLKNYDVHLIDLEGNITQGLIKNRTPKPNMIGTNLTSFQPNGDILYLPVLGDTIYNISMTQKVVQPTFLLKIDGDHIKGISEDQRQEIGFETYIPEYTSWEEKGYVLPQEMFSTDNALIFNFGGNLRHIYSKTTYQSYSYNPAELKGDPGQKYLTQRIMTAKDNWLYQPHNAIRLKTVSERVQFSEQYQKMIDSLETDANPVIVRFKLKDF